MANRFREAEEAIDCRPLLERAGIVCSDLRGETLNLEDAFIGLTGKY